MLLVVKILCVRKAIIRQTIMMMMLFVFSFGLKVSFKASLMKNRAVIIWTNRARNHSRERMLSTLSMISRTLTLFKR